MDPIVSNHRRCYLPPRCHQDRRHAAVVAVEALGWRIHREGRIAGPEDALEAVHELADVRQAERSPVGVRPGLGTLPLDLAGRLLDLHRGEVPRGLVSLA